MENQTFGMETNISSGNGSQHLERGLASLLPQNRAMEITNKIGLYSIMIVSPIGVLLNALALIVLIKIKNYKTSTGLLLVCIAIGDTCVLIGIVIIRALTFQGSFYLW